MRAPGARDSFTSCLFFAGEMAGEYRLRAPSVFVCGDRKLKGQALGVLAKMPASGGILFHEFGPRAPCSAWGFLKLIDHQPRVDESGDDLAKGMIPLVVRCMSNPRCAKWCNGGLSGEAAHEAAQPRANPAAQRTKPPKASTTSCTRSPSPQPRTQKDRNQTTRPSRART